MTSSKTAGLVICPSLRNCPQGWSWGWSENYERRMHIQPFPRRRQLRKCFIWLEKDGKRGFEPEGNIPDHVLKAVRNRLLHLRRLMVEADWVKMLIRNQWIRPGQSDSEISIVIYPESAEERVIRNRGVTKAFQRLQARYGSVQVKFSPRGGLHLVPPSGGEPRIFFLPRIIWGNIT